MKVKIYSGSSRVDLENAINDFLSGVTIEIIDIKFTSCTESFDVMIVYKEKGE